LSYTNGCQPKGLIFNAKPEKGVIDKGVGLFNDKGIRVNDNGGASKENKLI
jgi:hypothetical protein